MPIDLKKSFANVVVEKPIANGITISSEGLALVSVNEDGVEKVKPSTTSTSEVLVGWAVQNNEQPGTAMAFETVVVPATSPYTVTLTHNNLSATSTASIEQVTILDVVAATNLTQVSGAPAAAQFGAAPTTGILTFNAAEAGKTMQVMYRHDLTLTQSVQQFFSPSINNTAVNALGIVGVMTGVGQLFTLNYDAQYVFTPATALKMTTGGMLTTAAGTGTDISAKVRVIKSPTSVDLSLGVEFSLS